MTLKIDILYTEDCTEWQTADQLVQQALNELGIEAEISYWMVESDRQAIEWGFAGSPTIFVNGADLFPSSRNSSQGLTLRSYITNEGIMGHPTYQMIIDALRAFA